MKTTKLIICVLAIMFAAAPVFATNITIADDNNRNPIVGVGQGGEDNETEPGMVLSQDWDLEGFFFENNELTLVGGYNFKDGFDGMASGDIFISTLSNGLTYGDIDRTPLGDSVQTVLNAYGYDYVLDLSFSGSGGSYLVYNINSNTVVKTAKYDENEGSSPWQYDTSFSLTAEGSNTYSNSSDDAIASGNFSFGVVTDTDFSGMGGNNVHYSLTGFDLSFLEHGTEFFSHYTMECGNDNLMGQGTVVPEPATMILLGSGLVGLALYRRRMKK